MGASNKPGAKSRNSPLLTTTAPAADELEELHLSRPEKAVPLAKLTVSYLLEKISLHLDLPGYEDEAPAVLPPAGASSFGFLEFVSRLTEKAHVYEDVGAYEQQCVDAIQHPAVTWNQAA